MSASKPDGLIFSIVSPDGYPVAPGELVRATTPLPGDTILIFNFPDVLRFVVERLEIRRDWWPLDWLEAQKIVLRRDGVVSRSFRRPVTRTSASQIGPRLRDAFDRAIEALPEKTAVHLSQSDFDALCDSEGIDTLLRNQLAATAYCDVPLAVAPAGERASLIDGFAGSGGYAGDLASIYITRRDGTAFVPDAAISTVVEAFFKGKLSKEDATLKLFGLIVPRLLGRGGRHIMQRIMKTLSEVKSLEAPRWLAVQDLTELKLSLIDSLASGHTT